MNGAGSCRGGILDAGEDPAVAATREVLEETGWRPSQVEHLVSFQPMPGMVDTPQSIFLGTGAKKVGQPTDLEEAAYVEWIPLSAITGLISKGQILGSGSLVGLLLLISRKRDHAADCGESSD
jgi:8-oxo-dGTP pyrophosphatase MutT (NUDIX family)